MNKLKEKLTRGEKAMGTHIHLRGPHTTEVIARLGFDYLWIDTEHTSLSLQDVEDHLLAARYSDTTCLVRIPWNDPVRAKPILEMGPGGLIFPMVRSYEEALQAVQSCMYPPKGFRGFGPRRANFYGLVPQEEYLRTVDDEVMRIIQIEHVDCVRDLDRIVTIDEIDAYIIGPMDLSGSIGKLGQTEDPEVKELMRTAVAKVHAAGKPIGVSFGMCQTVEEAKRWFDMGMDMVSLAQEIDFIIDGCRKTLQLMKDAAE